jgi:hypothetical protein
MPSQRSQMMTAQDFRKAGFASVRHQQEIEEDIMAALTGWYKVWIKAASLRLYLLYETA